MVRTVTTTISMRMHGRSVLLAAALLFDACATPIPDQPETQAQPPTATTPAQAPAIPAPARSTVLAGEFLLTGRTRVRAADGDAEPVARYFVGLVGRARGIQRGVGGRDG